MHLGWFDLLLLLTIFGYVWGGFWTGLIQSIGGLVGTFVGVIVASRTYVSLGDWSSLVFANNHTLANVFAFVLVFLIVSRLIGLAFFLVNKIFHFIAIIPGLKFINRLGGAIFGFLEGALFIGITLQFMSRLPISSGFAETLAHSKLSHYFLAVTAWLVPLFPAFLKQATNAVDSVLKNTNVNTNINVNQAVNAAQTVKNSGLLNSAP